MRRRDGKQWPISSRFQRLTQGKKIQAELDELVQKLSFQAERLGYDLEDDDVTTSLIKNVADEGRHVELREATEAQWAEHFLSLAYVQTLIVSHDLHSDENVSALCLGNWAVGILSGLSDKPEQRICSSCAIKRHASLNGKAGAAKKFAPFRELEKWTREKYQSGTWPSANKAAHALKEEVIAHGRAIGAVLSNENAQRTIAEWLRKKNVSV